MDNRFCFITIVKNESHVIRRCLDSIANLADSYLICDTGSADDTVKIIETYMKEKNIPGEVIYCEWKNYSYNRNYLMDQAYTHNKSRNAKYLIWHDADEVFLTDPSDLTSYPTKNDTDKLYNFLESKSEPGVNITTIYSSLKYPRWNIVRNNQLYKWISPKHEYITGPVDNRSTQYDGFVLWAKQEGAASKDPDRCKKDSQMYLDYFNENGGPENCPREVFYMAQECESFDKEKAIEYYKLRTTLIGDWSEKYITYLRLGRLCTDEQEKVKYWEEGFCLDPNRLECVHELMKLFKDKNWSESLKYGIAATESRKVDSSKLFVEYQVYDYLYDLDFSLAAYYNKRYQLANDINQRNMVRNKGKAIYGRLVDNQKFIDGMIRDNGLIKLGPVC